MADETVFVEWSGSVGRLVPNGPRFEPGVPTECPAELAADLVEQDGFTLVSGELPARPNDDDHDGDTLADDDADPGEEE